MVGLRRFPTLIGLGLLWGVAAFVTIVVLAFLSFLGPLVILLWLAAITAWARPEITSLMASPVALSGTCTMSMLAMPQK